MLRKFVVTSVAGCALAIGAMGAEIIVKIRPPHAVVEFTRVVVAGRRAMLTRGAIIAGMEMLMRGRRAYGYNRLMLAPSG